MRSRYGRDQESSWYDVAQICLNGHLITDVAESKPERLQNFCDKCGNPTITKCQNENCNTPIHGFEHIPNVFYVSHTVPRCCHACGEMYPWIQGRVSAALELVEELALSAEIQEEVKKCIIDLVQDSPRIHVAAARFNRLVAQAGSGSAIMLRDSIADILNDSAKKLLFP